MRMKTRIRGILLGLLTACGTLQSCASESGPVDEPVVDEPRELLFEDEFDTFDQQIWTKEVHEAGWTNQELQIYDTEHVTVGQEGGKSVLILTAERKNGKIYSGRINSKGKKSFCYGRMEASIRLPKTMGGLWPAFWMMGDSDKEWPECGEIDIMEMGEKSGMLSGVSERQVNTAIHYGQSVDTHEQQYFKECVPYSLQDGNYHTYALEWDEHSLQVWVDEIAFHTFDIENNEYFHDKFFLLLNLAVGGEFTGILDTDKITALKEGQKVEMYVDWVRVYK